MKNALILVLVLTVVAFALFYIFGSDATPLPRSGADRRATTSETDTSTDSDPVAKLESGTTPKAAETPVAPDTTADAEAAAATAERAVQRADILKKLRDPATTASEQSKLWRKLGELGLTDDFIEELRAELKLAPRDADLHTMLGNALVTKMRTQTLTPIERREASTGAMKSFNTALEIDPQNWTARFSRAMSNSAAPAFLGLQAVAIKDFETLIEQQRGASPSPDHAHTYFFLANLQAGSGNEARAREVRAEAHELFPDDPRFKEKRE